MLLNHNEAPYPYELEKLVNNLTYRPGWRFALRPLDRGQGSKGLTLEIYTKGYNSYRQEDGNNYRVYHYMPVPPAAYNAESWQRWLFEQLLLVERHECMEFFTIAGEKPYAPNHGFGEDPYIVRELTTPEARRTSFRNELKSDT